jgi:hypothetical protein
VRAVAAAPQATDVTAAHGRSRTERKGERGVTTTLAFVHGHCFRQGCTQVRHCMSHCGDCEGAAALRASSMMCWGVLYCRKRL